MASPCILRSITTCMCVSTAVSFLDARGPIHHLCRVQPPRADKICKTVTQRAHLHYRSHRFLLNQTPTSFSASCCLINFGHISANWPRDSILSTTNQCVAYNLVHQLLRLSGFSPPWASPPFVARTGVYFSLFFLALHATCRDMGRCSTAACRGMPPQGPRVRVRVGV